MLVLHIEAGERRRRRGRKWLGDSVSFRQVWVEHIPSPKYRCHRIYLNDEIDIISCDCNSLLYQHTVPPYARIYKIAP